MNRLQTIRPHGNSLMMAVGLSIGLLLPATAHAADNLELLDGQFFANHSTDTDGAASLGVSFSQGDGFWDLSGNYGSLDQSVVDLQFKFRASTRLIDQVYIGTMLPFVRRELDVAVPDSEDIVNIGLGDIMFWATYRIELSDNFAFGPWIEWKLASGEDEVAYDSNEVIAEVLPSPITGVALGTGQNDVDLWLTGHFDNDHAEIYGGVGYRRRTNANTFYVMNNQLPTRLDSNNNVIDPGQVNDRIVAAVDGAWKHETLRVGAALQYFHDAKPNSVNTLDGALRLRLDEPEQGLYATADIWIPLYGRDYPDIPPYHFLQRSPTVGTRLETSIGLRF